MKLVTYKDVTYRDMPYKMVMTNASGDTAFLYDSNKHMTTMTPFKYDEREIDNPELIVSLDELVDNLIHGDLHQSENYTNIIENNIEQLGELELEDQDRLYLTEVICTWAKRSKYVQQFEKEFDKIGIDISNILYEIDPEYNDLIESCKKSEEKNLEEIKTDEKTEIEEEKEEIKEENTEDKAPEGLEEIDPEMQEEVEREMKESRPDELKDEKVENDNKEIENTELEETTNANPTGDGTNSEGANASNEQTEVETVAPTEQVSTVQETSSEEKQEEQQATISTDPVSTVTTNPLRLTSEYELVQPYVEPMADLLNRAWISLVYYDVDRSEKNQKEFYDRLDYAFKNSVTPEEVQYLQDVIDKWKNTGGVFMENPRLYEILTMILKNRATKLPKNQTDAVFSRDVALLSDDANYWLSELEGDKKNDHIEYASTDYRLIISKINSASPEVTKKSLEQARKLSSAISKKICSTSVEVTPEELEGNFMQTFNKESYEINRLLELSGKGGPKADDLEFINWKFDKLKAMCRHMPYDLNPNDKRIVTDYIYDIEKYLKQFKNNGLNNQYLESFNLHYKRLKRALEEYEYTRKKSGIDSNQLETLASLARRTYNELEGLKNHMTVEQYKKYEEELHGIKDYTKQEEQTLEEFRSMMRRF